MPIDQDITLLAHLAVLVAGAIAGFVDSIAGGGGLITVPSLLAVGLPPHLVLGTNKLASTMGVLTALSRYRDGGLVRLREWALAIACTAAGAATGTLLIQRLEPSFLGWLVPVLLVAILVYTLMSPDLGSRPAAARVGRRTVQVGGGLVLGFHDGFFGPGTGAFWALALVTLAGLDLRRATAATKVMNATSNVVALGVFTLGGHVVWSLGLAMGAGQILGALLGSRQVLRRTPGFVRWFLVATVGLTAGKMLLDRLVG
ncbi:TSUP family transporter [bacterium]|nr:TSUP family transporter [bacterium]